MTGGEGVRFGRMPWEVPCAFGGFPFGNTLVVAAVGRSEALTTPFPLIDVLVTEVVAVGEVAVAGGTESFASVARALFERYQTSNTRATHTAKHARTKSHITVESSVDVLTGGIMYVCAACGIGIGGGG